MIKRILITLIILINTGAIYAQQYTAKNLIGQWQEARLKKSKVVFYTDSTGALIGAGGFLYNKINYSAKVNKDIIELKYTIQIDKKKPSYARPYIRFLNDSTFLMRFIWAPKHADTANKKVSVFIKVKDESPAAAIIYPSYKDLLGQWVLIFKNEQRPFKLNFIDSNRVIQKTSASITLMDYVVDFTKQPITIDFYLKGILIKQSFLSFRGRGDFRIEDFDPGKRKDHFTVFGQNYMYRREKPL